MKVRVRRRAGGEVTGEGNGLEVTLAGLEPKGHPGSLRRFSEEPGKGSDCRRLGRSGLGGGVGRGGEEGCIWPHTSGLVGLDIQECPSGQGWSSRLALGISPSLEVCEFCARS